MSVRLDEIEHGVAEGLLGGVRAIANLVPLAASLVMLSSTLALVALCALAAFAIGLRLVRLSIRARGRHVVALAEQLHADLDELVRGLDLWRTYGAAEPIRRAILETSERRSEAAGRVEASRTALSAANEALAAAALLLTVLAAQAGLLSFEHGSIVAFAVVFFLVYRPLRDLADARTALERGADAFASLARDIEGAGDAPRSDVAAAPLRRFSLERLVVRGVAVKTTEWSTPEVSFEADPGQIVAIVGPTGAGKTSLLRAMLGLERGSVGEVVYGDEPLSGAGVGPSARPFAWVPQEVSIISGTIVENIQLAGGDSEAAKDALERMGAATLLARGLDAHVSAGGPQLSGGERQWIAIARAIASEQPVMLLDEPTSGLDRAAQASVIEALRALRGTRTIVIVTHRVEPLAIADQVIEL